MEKEKKSRRELQREERDRLLQEEARERSQAKKDRKRATYEEERARILEERDRAARVKARRARRRKVIIVRTTLLTAFLFLLGAGIYYASNALAKDGARAKAKAEKEAEINAEEQRLADRRAAIARADALAETYDYDAAIDLLKSQDDYENDADLLDGIARYMAAKTSLVAKDVTTVPHIFFHSLLVDPERTFDEKWDADTRAGMNAWMTTVEEFDKIIQQMYDNGYVLVRMRDLVTVETDEETGKKTYAKNKSLMLPADKKPYVLSIDDWSYYHSYDGKGLADKAVLDENGEVKCQYTDAQGNVSIGDYDVLPRLNTFLKAHPDAAYRGARGMIAMTGYNGVFGYRTDVAYKTRERLDADQAAYLAAHPEFDYDAEVREAKKIADAVKAGGWEFACHTWGHLSVTGKSVETLSADQDKWQNTVANITGPTDTIIFAHGNDIGSWRDYDAETNPVYAYYKSMGYDFYANVDASAPYWLQIRGDYLRQGRIDCDGLQMWRAISGAAKINVFEDLFDVESVFDKRRPTPVSASGKR